MTTDTHNSGSGNWPVPAGVTSVEIEPSDRYRVSVSSFSVGISGVLK